MDNKSHVKVDKLIAKIKLLSESEMNKLAYIATAIFPAQFVNAIMDNLVISSYNTKTDIGKTVTEFNDKLKGIVLKKNKDFLEMVQGETPKPQQENTEKESSEDEKPN